MSLSRRAWLVVVSVGAVEAQKDQGVCRCNYTFRPFQQHAKSHARSMSQAKKLSSQSSAAVSHARDHEKMHQADEPMRKVMYLSCWGPN